MQVNTSAELIKPNNQLFMFYKRVNVKIFCGDQEYIQGHNRQLF